MPKHRAAALVVLALIAGGTVAMGDCGTQGTDAQSSPAAVWSGADWPTASPESQGLVSSRLRAIGEDLAARHTKAFVVIRNDRIVFERYAAGYTRTTPHYTASLAKALVGGASLMVAMNDGRIKPDDRASRFVPQWAQERPLRRSAPAPGGGYPPGTRAKRRVPTQWVDGRMDDAGGPHKQAITIRHLATHTSGIEDAEADELPHDQLTGWKGDFWKRLAPPRDPFTLSRDHAPILDEPGTRPRYSNPGMAMLSYCVTASLRGTADPDLRSLLKHRVMDPLGVAEAEWSCGYGASTALDGLPLVANWGGGSYSPNAAARVGRLMLHQGSWNGKPLLSPSTVQAATTPAGMPNYSGLGWWVNREPDGRAHWQSAPKDAFWGAGAGQQFLLVVPSLDLIVVRFGDLMDSSLTFDQGLETHLVAPLMNALARHHAAPYPPSPVIKSITWAPPPTIVRQASDSDCWPLTWGDDDHLYTAYGDGYGFEPRVPEKLSLGFARISGAPPEFSGANIRAPSIEEKGDGPSGKKASGLLMVEGVLYMWVRNAANSQLAWSSDHGKSWTRSDWKFTKRFGCPTFLNFGRNYAGARDNYAYVYSHDADSAYNPADRMVLARVPKAQIRDRNAYEFFRGLGANGRAMWTRDITRRGAVFTHPGRCYRSSVTYNAALRRYLWCQTLPGTDAHFRGGFGIYDAPEPWGPWTTVYFTEQWDVGPGETSSFPTKWMSADGKTLFLVFSGEDHFSTRKATLTLWEGD